MYIHTYVHVGGIKQVSCNAVSCVGDGGPGNFKAFPLPILNVEDGFVVSTHLKKEKLPLYPKISMGHTVQCPE